MDNSTNDNAAVLMVRYLDHEMPVEEKKDFEEKMANDAHIRQQLDDLLLTREAIFQYGLAQQVAHIRQEMLDSRADHSLPAPKTARVRRLIRFSISVAATLFLAWVSFEAYQYFSISPSKIFSQQFSHYELPVLRSTEQKAVSELEIAYRDKDFNRVVKLCKLSNPSSLKENYLCGMAEMELGNYADAESTFEKIILANETNATHIFKDESEYNLALAYLQQKKYQKAIELFNSIHNNPFHLYHNKVSSHFIRSVKRLR